MVWMRLHIGGQKWTINLVAKTNKHLNDDGERCVGRCVFDTCNIYISKALSDQAREDTLIHELLHALLYVTGAEKIYDADGEKEEAFIQAVTPTLHRMIKDLGFMLPNIDMRAV